MAVRLLAGATALSLQLAAAAAAPPHPNIVWFLTVSALLPPAMRRLQCAAAMHGWCC
jgi:hypothetical protein|eukprot:COSAG06_NODE_18447_length_887_cov_1.365482_2_plen_57_part_00